MTDKEYFDFTNRWLKESKRVLKENGSIFISTTYHNL
jgi:DNA modification methylase